MTRQAPLHHVPALDGLRGLAILLVVLHNAAHFPNDASGALWLIALIATVGWIGVQLFFVLSGFLITSGLLDNQQAPDYYRVFFARRVLRIFPLYYAALLAGLVIAPLLVPSLTVTDATPAHAFSLVTFLYNWVHPFDTGVTVFPHFWSLAVEEQFYLLWPFLIHRRSLSGTWKLCLWIAAAALAIRVLLRLSGASAEVVYEYTFCRMDALALGAAVAVALRMPTLVDRIKQLTPWLVPIAGGLALAGAVTTWAYTRNDFTTQTHGHTILAITFALLLLAAVVDSGKINRWWQRLLELRALRAIGKYSYGMYVAHFPINLGMERLLPQFQALFGRIHPLAFFAAVLSLTYVAALLTYHLLEKHFLRLKPQFAATRPLAERDKQLEHA